MLKKDQEKKCEDKKSKIIEEQNEELDEKKLDDVSGGVGGMKKPPLNRRSE